MSVDHETHTITTADVSGQAFIGEGTKIWNFSHVREGARIGIGCIIGRGVYVGPGVCIGNHCKVQNYALIYEPAVLDDGVFVGPSAVLTNDTHPRAINPDGTLKLPQDWRAVGVHLCTGASVGARAVCVAPVTIGRWAMVAAGAVVTRDVPDYALVAGAPARRVGWVGEAGHRLEPDGEGWSCPATRRHYRVLDGELGPA